MASELAHRKSEIPWKKCCVCEEAVNLKSPREFVRHLRDFHCTKEGGSYICHYGPHHTCSKLPIEGVSDRDYEEHLLRYHLTTELKTETSMAKSSGSGGSSDGSRSPTPGSGSEPSVVHDQHKWTAFMSKVNLPALLNDPTLARRETDIFTKTWGENFERTTVQSSPYLQDIGREHFKKYLRKVGARLQNHEKAQARREAQKEELDFPAFNARLAAERSRAELEAIPKIYMLPNFTLENPDVFSAVFPWHQIEQSHTSGSRQSSCKLLQEKLSHYLDLVEVQISKQISLQSEAFFQAVCSQDKVTENIGYTRTAVKHLREKMRQLESQTVEGPLKVIKLARVRANYIKVLNKLKLMGTVHQTQPTIQLLLATNEFVGALDLIATTQEVLSQELPGIHCFRHLSSQLTELEKLIDAMMQEDFVRYATADLNRPLSEDKVMDEERLVAVILGMLRKQLYNFIGVYREEACTTIKALVKQTVIEAVTAAEDIDQDNSVASLADQMRLLNYSQWMEMLENVFSVLMLLLKRVKNVVGVMIEVVQVAAGSSFTCDNSPDSEVLFQNSDLPNGTSSPNHQHDNGFSEAQHTANTPSSPTTSNRSLRVSVSNDVEVMLGAGECIKVIHSLNEMLCQVCDHAQDRCVKLIVARGKDGFIGRLSSAEFVQLSHTIENFVEDCQGLCGRLSASLRGCLQSEANKFVNRFHDERKNKLSLILDNERWKQADVPAEFQHLVNHIIQAGTLTLPNTKPNSAMKPQDVLQVNGKSYAVVGTVLLLLKMVVEYCQCVLYIPTVTADILSRLVELLKMFNSRTCQLILGAGALQLVGLKTITTKNLALASRCLQLVLYFLPQVREHFESRLQGKQTNMLKHFDHVIKDYSDHIVEIDNKLVAIMETMIDMQLAKWEVKAPMPSMAFRSICKQIGKLHEAISELLPEEQIQQLFDRVIKSFRIHLRGILIKLGVTNDGGPQHGLVSADLAFFTGSIKNLKGLDKLNLSMDDIWDKR